MKLVHLLFFILSLCCIPLLPIHDVEHLGSYTIRTVRIAGIFTGKHIYKKLYRLSKGTPFEQHMHDAGLRAIETHLHHAGYCRAQVKARCDYHDKENMVDITILIAPGPRFSIGSVSCSVADSVGASDELNDLFRKIEQRIASRLKKVPCTKDILDAQARMISDYCKKKGYLSVLITMEQRYHESTSTVDIIFTCSLHDKKKFTFIGNNALSVDELQRVCAEFGRALSIVPPALLAQELRDLYHKKGYLDVIIEYDDDPCHLLFTIKEFSRSRIERVTYNDSPIAETPQLVPFFINVLSKPYDYDTVQRSVSRVIRSLVENGYWKATLRHTQLYKLPSGNYELALGVDPGQQLIITAITGDDFDGILTWLYRQSWCKKYAPCFMNQKKTVCIVDSGDIELMRKSLQKELHERGYLYTSVVPHILEHDGSSRIRWEFTGSEKIRYGQTIIRGSSVLSESTIREALRYKKGDVWSRKKLDETAAVLRNFGVFDQVTVFPENIALPEREKKIIIQVQDSDPFELRARAGFQGVGTNLTWRGGATYKVGGTFLWKNPRKAADILSVQLDITRFLRYATLMYQLAFFGNLPIKQQFKVYSNRYDQPVVLGSREILYRYAQDGFLWALSQDTAALKWGVTTGVDWMKLSDISKKLSHAINFTTRFVDKHIPYFFCEPSAYISSIDDRLNPFAGWYLVLSSKAFVPLGVPDASFIKFLIEQGSYIPLYRPWHMMFAIRLRVGSIVYQDFATIMPPERFYLGGAYSLRGYEPDLAPPLNFYKNSNQELIIVPTGGKTMMNGNFEIRFTIVRSLGGTLFTDIGILMQRAITDIQAKDILGASGFGLRWNTPVGPLRFDIGWKWKRFPGNEHFYDQASCAWFLTLGNAF